MQWSENERRLGMDRGITWRDFLDGIALTIGAAALGGFHARSARAETAAYPFLILRHASMSKRIWSSVGVGWV